MTLFKTATIQKLLILLIGITFLSGCNRHEKEKGAVLAKAYGNFLYQKDIEDLIPENINPRDSLLLVKSAINSWLKEQVLINKANSNLPEDKRDFEKLINRYRNSLIIYNYEDLLVQQSLDTIVTPEEIEEYYQLNQSNFQLKEDIVKYFCVKLSSDSEHLGELKDILESKSPSADSLMNYCNINHLDYSLESDHWFPFENLLNIVPLKSYNHEAFLKNNRMVTIEENPITYLIYFFDFKVKNGVSPLEFEKNRIISMILNSRKEKFLKEMRQSLFQDALNQGDFEIY